MSNNLLSVSLAELQDNLKNIESTQKQVQTLVDVMDTLTRSYQQVLIKVESVNDNLVQDNSIYKDSFATATKQFSSNVEVFEKQLGKNFDKTNNAFDQLIQSQKQSFNTNKSDLEKHTSEFSKYINNFRKNLDKESKDMIQESRKRVDDLNSLFLNQGKIFEKSIQQKIETINSSNTLTIIDEVSNKVVDLSLRIDELKDLHKMNQEFLHLMQKTNDERIQAVKEELKKKATLNSIITCGGVIVLVVIMYLLSK